MDYIVAAGGIDYQTANVNNIELIDRQGNRSEVVLTDEVPPGTMIYVNQNILQKADDVFDNVLIVTAWITGISAIITAVVSLVDLVQTNIPSN